jgi:acetyltransferase EpsM
MHPESRKPLVIVGTGGHALVVADAALRAGQYDLRGFLDQNPAKAAETILGRPVLGTLDLVRDDAYRDVLIIVAIGDNGVRKRVAAELEAAGCSFATIIHPSAQIGSETSIGKGTMILGGVVINPGTRIGCHVIVNTSASVDHHGRIEDYVHISPGVALAGGVSVGCGSHVGIGASVVEQVEIGARTVIGAGAVVTQSIPDDVVAMGVPARIARQRTEESERGKK